MHTDRPPDPPAVCAELRVNCPRCQSTAFSRLSDYDTPWTAASGGSFFFALATWLYVALLTPSCAIILWYPTRDSITPTGLAVLRVLGLVSEVCVWVAVNVAWLFLVAGYGLFMYGHFIGGCATCRSGVLGDHVFAANSLGSRIILGLVSIANLRFNPWLRVAAIATMKIWFAFIILSFISNPVVLRVAATLLIVIHGALLPRYYIERRYIGQDFRAAMGIGGLMGAIVAGACAWFSAKGATLIYGVPLIISVYLVGMIHNVHSRLIGVSLRVLNRAGLIVMKRLPLLFLLMLPGLALKAGVDWYANRCPTAVETRAATLDTVTVPTIRMETYQRSSKFDPLTVVEN